MVTLGVGMSGPDDTPFTTSTVTFLPNASGTLHFSYSDNPYPPDISSGYMSVDGINLGYVGVPFSNNSGTWAVTGYSGEIFLSFSGGGRSSLSASMYLVPIT